MKNKYQKKRLIETLLVASIFLMLPFTSAVISSFSTDWLENDLLLIQPNGTAEYCIYLQNIDSVDTIQKVMVEEGSEHFVDVSNFNSSYNVPSGTRGSEMKVCSDLALPNNHNSGDKHKILFSVTTKADVTATAGLPSVTVGETIFISDKVIEEEPEEEEEEESSGSSGSSSGSSPASSSLFSSRVLLAGITN